MNQKRNTTNDSLTQNTQYKSHFLLIRSQVPYLIYTYWLAIKLNHVEHLNCLEIQQKNPIFLFLFKKENNRIATIHAGLKLT